VGLPELLRPKYFRGLRELELQARQTELQTERIKFRRAQIGQVNELLKRRGATQEDSGSYQQIGTGPLIDDDSGPLFDLIAYGTDDAIDEASFREVQRRWYKMWVQDPLAHGWIELFVNHIVGDKFQMKSKDHDEKTQDVWDEQAKSMAGPTDGPLSVPPYPFPTFAQDLVRDTLIFGEEFEREYTNRYDGSMAYRSMNPVWLYNPGRQWPFRVKEWTPNVYASFGIQTDPEDIQRPTTYWYDPNRTGVMQGIDAQEVIHSKIGSRRMKRGRSILLSVTKPLLQLNKLLQSRNDMHLLRTVVAYWDELQDGQEPNVVADMTSGKTIGDDSSGNQGVNTGRTYNDEHGSTGTFNNLKRQYATPNLQAADAYSDILAHCYPMARSLGLTLASAWGDTSQETQASARENSFGEILTFQTWAYWFALNTFNRIGERRIKSAINAGMLSATSFEKFDEISGPVGNNIRSKGQRAVPRNTGFDCEFPELRVRDVKALTDSLMAQLSVGIIDKREARIQLGIDADDMEDRVMVEKLDNPDEDRSAAAELAAMGGNGNGKEPHQVGKNGRSDSKAIYRNVGNKS
jgi:hypothetical protein